MDLDIIPDITMRGQGDPHGRSAVKRPPTVGQLASLILDRTGRPGDWWHLVRFDPAGPARVPLDGVEDADLWLTVWPPGCRAHLRPHESGTTQVAVLIAGELAELTIASHGVTERPLRANRIRVFGGAGDRPGRVDPADRAGVPWVSGEADEGHLHELANPGGSFAITLHASVAG